MHLRAIFYKISDEYIPAPPNILGIGIQTTAELQQWLGLQV